MAYANAVLEASEDDPGRTNIYRVGLRDERARAYLLSAIVAAVAGRQSDCSQLLTSMFSESVGLAEIDRELYSKLLLLLAYRVRDFAAEVDSEFWKRSLKEIETWPENLSFVAFDIMRALASTAVTRGDIPSSLSLLRRGVSVTKLLPYKIIGLVDRASLSRQAGEHANAVDELGYALELAESVNWSALGEERVAFAQLAQEVSQYMPERAVRLYERYKRVRTFWPATNCPIDRRTEGHELLAEAIVRKHSGQAETSIHLLVQCFELWNAIGYENYAAAAAVEIAELRESTFFASYARQYASRRHDALLSRRCEGIESCRSSSISFDRRAG